MGQFTVHKRNNKKGVESSFKLEDSYRISFILKQSTFCEEKKDWIGMLSMDSMFSPLWSVGSLKYEILNYFKDRFKVNFTHKWFHWYGLGLVSAREGNYYVALQQFQNCCMLKKNFDIGIYWTGKMHELLCQQEEALAIYKIATEINPHNWRAWIGRAELLTKKGMFSSAYKCAQEATKVKNRIGDVHGVLAYLSCKIQQEDLFTVYLSNALRFGLTGGQLMINLSHCAINKERYLEALQLIDAVLKSRSNDHVMLNNKGYCLSMLGKHKESLSAYKEAHSVVPADVEVIINIGNSYLQLNDIVEAIKWYDLGISLSPNALLFNNKAMCLDWKGRYDDAVNLYYKAMKLDPGNELYEENYNLSLINAGKYQEALEIYLKSFHIKNAESKKYESIGYCLYQLGRYNDALRVFYAGHASDPENPVFLIRIGLCLEKLNKKEEALVYYQSVLNKNIS